MYCTVIDRCLFPYDRSNGFKAPMGTNTCPLLYSQNDKLKVRSWAELGTKYFFVFKYYKYMLKMYLNTKYFLQMYLILNTLMYLNTFVNTFLYYFPNIVLIHWIHYKFENERNIGHKISSIIQYVNNITDMHVIYYITCW